MNKELKEIPKFEDDKEERKFWETHSSMDYVDWSKSKLGIFFEAKPSTQTISIRFPKITLAKLKQKANAIDIPYQALIKQYVDRGLRETPKHKYRP